MGGGRRGGGCEIGLKKWKKASAFLVTLSSLPAAHTASFGPVPGDPWSWDPWRWEVKLQDQAKPWWAFSLKDFQMLCSLGTPEAGGKGQGATHFIWGFLKAKNSHLSAPGISPFRCASWLVFGEILGRTVLLKLALLQLPEKWYTSDNMVLRCAENLWSSHLSCSKMYFFLVERKMNCFSLLVSV